MSGHTCSTASRSYVKTTLSALVYDEDGQDLIEYALVAALVGLGAVSALKGLSTKIGSVFTGIGSTLTSAV